VLEAEWARAKRDDTSLSLLLIDVDHLKKFNNRCGHQAGDGCLRAIARCMRPRTADADRLVMSGQLIMWPGAKSA
jgi:diguanylate cyclase (GGDEF)-like protein